MKLKILSLALLLSSGSALADWTLSPDSNLKFITTKNTNISEVHHFNSMKGTVNKDGSAEVQVDLSSVETGIPIRNERMQSMLFDTTKFATLTITSDLPSSLIDSLNNGKTLMASLPLKVSLHGITANMTAEVISTQNASGQVTVSTVSPMLIKASDFGLVEGVEALRNVAGLERISTTVPVIFTLLFDPK